VVLEFPLDKDSTHATVLRGCFCDPLALPLMKLYHGFSRGVPSDGRGDMGGNELFTPPEELGLWVLDARVEERVCESSEFLPPFHTCHPLP
jgi:hypothetical protein